MSFQERRSIVNLISTIMITVVYSADKIQDYPQGNPYSVEVFRFWGEFFLILILVSIVAKIIINICFIILNAIITRQDELAITDERDRLIELKSNTYALYVFSVGFLLAMLVLVMEMSPSMMFVILICAGVVSDVVSEASQFYFYRRGF